MEVSTMVEKNERRRKIEARMKYLGLSQQNVADGLNIARTTFLSWINEPEKMSFKSLKELSEILKYDSVDDFIRKLEL